MGNVAVNAVLRGCGRAFRSDRSVVLARGLALVAIGAVSVLGACAPGDSHRVGEQSSMAGSAGSPITTAGAAAPMMAGATGGAVAGTAGDMALPVAGEMALPIAGDTSVAGIGGAGGSAGTGVMPPEDRVFDAGSDPNRNNVVAGQICGRLAQIQCAGEAFCCDNPGRERAACEDAMRTGCIEQMFLDAISSNPISAFDATTAATTFAEIERLAMTCDPSIADFGASREGLMGMFRGTEEEGESCAPGLTMNRATAAAKLASCTNIATIACLPTSALSWTCEPRNDVGGRCFTDVNCVDGLFCPNPNLSFGRATCAERKPVGASCELPNECSSLFCKGGACVEAIQQAAYCLTAL